MDLGLSPSAGLFNTVRKNYCRELDLVIQVAKSKGYILPTDYQLRQLNWFINEQKSGRLWSIRDLIYWTGFNSLLSKIINSSTGAEGQYESIEPFCRINLKNPLSNYLIQVGTRALGQYYNSYGFATNQSGGYDTQFQPGDGGTYNWVQNSASFACYLWTNLISEQGNSVAGNQDAINNRRYLDFAPRGVSNAVNIAVNRTSAFNNVGTTTDERGYWLIERTASNNTSAYQNNSLIGSTIAASQTLTSNLSIYLLCRNQAGSPSSHRTNTYGGYYAFGAALNSAALRKLDYDLVKELRTRLGFINN